MTFEELKNKAHSLPLKPGVYIMMDRTNTVIYVGKAKKLRNRVSQYFMDMASHTEKTRAMVSQIDHFDVIVADSEFEALVLENSQIKLYKPRYNILLKDDKGYPYIRLSVNEAYPRFSLSNHIRKDGASYFGPYSTRSGSEEILSTIQSVLKLPMCRKVFPRDIGKERPCLNYYLGNCAGWCRSADMKEQYDTEIRKAISILEGNYQEIADELRGSMEKAAEELRFEQAAALRDQIKGIEQLGRRQKVVAGSLADTDVIGYFRGTAKSCFVVLHYADGNLMSKDCEVFGTPADDDPGETVSGLIRQYYQVRTRIPRQILLPCQLEDAEVLAEFLEKSTGFRVSFFMPQRGEKRALVGLAVKNAEEEVALATTKEEKTRKILELLADMLKLTKPPVRIEAYDISNQGADDIVASMTVFENGRPCKKDYRRFRIRELEKPDDYASMEQVLTRRFRRYQEGDSKFSSLPDLILIDGGDRHAAVAERVLGEMELRVPVFGMVKDDRHRTRALIRADGSEVGIRQNQAVFSFIGQVQEETHRFAITYHRELQNKKMRYSELDQIPGIGTARKKALLQKFKSVKAIRSATVEELQSVVPQASAQAVFNHFHQEETAGRI